MLDVNQRNQDRRECCCHVVIFSSSPVQFWRWYPHNTEPNEASSSIEKTGLTFFFSLPSDLVNVRSSFFTAVIDLTHREEKNILCLLLVYKFFLPSLFSFRMHFWNLEKPHTKFSFPLTFNDKLRTNGLTKLLNACPTTNH